MSWLTAIALYVSIWFVVLFAVLPWGVKIEDKPETGHAPSAPSNPRLKTKMLVTCAIAAVLWLGAYALIVSDWISFRQQVP